MDCSMPGFPALHYLPEFAQTHVHWVSDAIQSTYPLSPLLPPTLNLSQHQDLSQEAALHVKWSSIGASGSASILLMTNQGWFPLGLTGLISLLSKGLSRVSSSIIQKHQFFGAQPSLWSNTHICTLNPNPWSELTLDNKMNTLILFFDFLSNHLLHLSKVPKCP